MLTVNTIASRFNRLEDLLVLLPEFPCPPDYSSKLMGTRCHRLSRNAVWSSRINPHISKKFEERTTRVVRTLVHLSAYSQACPPTKMSKFLMLCGQPDYHKNERSRFFDGFSCLRQRLRRRIFPSTVELDRHFWNSSYTRRSAPWLTLSVVG
ncbi:hypothetical protein CYLTODRAFT_283722 [Cylindrobasidium torrendii FP15055 ss-10]|uniref:Uncharacterized protein n=1 Tax=Cylindrobasidium torrendii FP15055 ss-10 TaxID=1314674 RepID=A0A0D7BRV5_9AGAR|nr:hypothetical protein CYLTODRAFT_283722 [Cylindrobasidium torrendii FP15055 ss-10]